MLVKEATDVDILLGVWLTALTSETSLTIQCNPPHGEAWWIIKIQTLINIDNRDNWQFKWDYTVLPIAVTIRTDIDLCSIVIRSFKIIIRSRGGKRKGDWQLEKYQSCLGVRITIYINIWKQKQPMIIELERVRTMSREHDSTKCVVYTGVCQNKTLSRHQWV